MTGRAMPEGTKRLSANEFIEASERLGAEIHADASWETLSATMGVPRSRFGPALALMAEMAFEPAFPGEEVDRLRDERMNDLLQAWSGSAAPRRASVSGDRVRAGHAVQQAVGRDPIDGPSLDRDAVVQRHTGLLDPSAATLVVAGDLTGVSLLELADEHLGQRSASGTLAASTGGAEANPAGARIVLVDRPSAPQSELRIGHLGVPRRTRTSTQSRF